jgi:hypothetical protein
MHEFSELDSFFDETATRFPAIIFHPMPVPARCCGVVLQATYAAENDFRCPNCLALVCYTCGCVENHACTKTVTTADRARAVTYTCGWAEAGICSFCYSRAAYELYQEATGRAADDPYYMSMGRSVRTVKGLGYGV